MSSLSSSCKTTSHSSVGYTEREREERRGGGKHLLNWESRDSVRPGGSAVCVFVAVEVCMCVHMFMYKPFQLNYDTHLQCWTVTVSFDSCRCVLGCILNTSVSAC